MRITNNKAVGAFFRLRGYLVGTVLLAYIIYDWFNLHNFLLVLVLTAAIMTVVAFVVSRIQRNHPNS